MAQRIQQVEEAEAFLSKVDARAGDLTRVDALVRTRLAAAVAAMRAHAEAIETAGAAFDASIAEVAELREHLKRLAGAR